MKIIPSAYTHVWTYFTPSSSGSTTYTTSYDLKRASGSSNPGWQSRILEGQFVASPYTSIVKTATEVSTFGYWFYSTIPHQPGPFVYTGFRDDPCGCSRSIALPPADILSEVDTEARQKILMALQDERPSIDSLPYITEWKQTRVLHKQVGESLINVIKDAIQLIVSRGLNPNAWRHLWADLSALYLAWFFAIKPTLGDCKKLAERLASENYPMGLHSISAKASYDWNQPTALNDVTLNTGNTTNVSIKRQIVTQCSVKVRYVVLVSLIPEKDGRPNLAFTSCSAILDTFNALSIKGILSNIWEVIPFSWAIDYFCQVSDMWNHDLKVLYGVKGCVKTTIYQTDYTSTHRVINNNPTLVTGLVSPGMYTLRVKSIVREVVDLSFSPEFYALPGMSVSAGWKQLSYLLAVYAQLRRPSFRNHNR